MTLAQLIAKLIDLEIDHADKAVLVRDGRGILAPANDVSVTVTSSTEYVEINP